MTKLQFLDELAKLLRAELRSLDDAAPLSGFAAWDSLSVLGVMAMAHRKTGRVIDAAALSRCKTVGDLARTVCAG